MMRQIGSTILLAVLLASFQSHAAVQIDLVVVIEGQQRKATIITDIGQTAHLLEVDADGTSGYEISATPFLVDGEDEVSPKNLRLSTVVSQFRGSTKETLAHPEVLVRVGELAIITQDEPGASKIELQLRPSIR